MHITNVSMRIGIVVIEGVDLYEGKLALL